MPNPASISLTPTIIPEAKPPKVHLTPENASELASQFLTTITPSSGDDSGRGIVICAGGRRYNTCAWVLIRTLRWLDCHLPIEVWSYEREFDKEWSALVSAFGVTVRLAANPCRAAPERWNGWQLKSSALLQSRFREVMLLDADIVPVRNPEFLFTDPNFISSGSLFWPDKSRTRRDSRSWQVFGVPYRDEWEQESGQLVVDKSRCWNALNLCRWYNEHADLYYRFVYGDKDTFRLAWHRTNTPFRMPSQPVSVRQRFLIQHDFSGQPLFQHRVHAKWTLDRISRLIGFEHEETCQEFLNELRHQWRVAAPPQPEVSDEDAHLHAELRDKQWLIIRKGLANWPIELEESGTVSQGWTTDMATWWLNEGKLYLGTSGWEPRYALTLADKERWVGAAIDNSRIQVELLARQS